MMNRSIDLLEDLAGESNNIFQLNRRGYLYATGSEQGLPAFIQQARQIFSLGAGALRVHDSHGHDYQPVHPDGYLDQPDGADLILDPALIAEHFPYLTRQTLACLHVRRAGWMSAQQLGMYLLKQARQKGIVLETARITGIDLRGGAIKSVRLNGSETVLTDTFINAAGPFLKHVSKLANIDLPVQTEMHLKAAINDRRCIIDRDSPVLIWNDCQYLPWKEAELRFLSSGDEADWMSGLFPSGAHVRPEGGRESQVLLMLWEYNKKTIEPVLPLPGDDFYPEIVLRGLATMVPGLMDYFDHMPKPSVDGGYYTKTPENRPLIGPTPIEGFYLIGALSGFGIMAACAAGELVSLHVSGLDLPEYAHAFELRRYDDPVYIQKLTTMTDSGQL